MPHSLHSTDDVRIASTRPLIAPAVLMGDLPMTEAITDLVADARGRIERIFRGEDDRLLVVVGPCSIHDLDVALEYGTRLKEQADEFQADLEIVMRVYFEKPRTTVGWKGFINDPHMDDTYDINAGLRMGRRLLLDLAGMGLTAGTEFLDVITPQYIADLVVWGAIGARTTESQLHRQLASGLSMPVGFKNGTDGNLAIAMDAIAAARGSHHFLSVTKQGVSAIVETKGNDTCHVILRGGRKPNFHEEDVEEALSQLRERNLPPYLMVDCSHGNSRKDFRNQPVVGAELCRQISLGQKGIAGVMIESHLVEGSQSLKPGVTLERGKSVTDACVGWDTTVGMLEEFAQAVKKRRENRGVVS